MNAGTRAYVLSRDRVCALSIVRRDHVCVDRWGNRQPSDHDLTIEHVREHPGGMRRDDEGWLVALCHRANTEHEGSTRENRALLNAYLAGARAEADMHR